MGRAAAQTQGVALPPIKRYKSGFVRLRALCGAVEVTPIHPFELERRVSERATIDEGLYVFDPGALGPHCGTVTLGAPFGGGSGAGRQAGRRSEDPRADLAGLRAVPEGGCGRRSLTHIGPKRAPA